MTGLVRPEPEPLRLQRTFRAPAQVVFDAWLNADTIGRWWPAGTGWATPVVEVDASVGGSLRLVMRSPDGEEFGGRGRYLEIDPPRRLVFTWTWDGPERDQASQLIEVEFEERGDGTTILVLTNRGLPTEESRRAHRRGWWASFDNLNQVLAT